ncbi:MAG: ABC-2 family transporter protein [Lachnospiraceae bacterium]|nr:ABC-2 family transporter protein [Lachnospiraceae bacterium]
MTFVIPLTLVQYYPLLYLLDRETGLLYLMLPLISLLFLIPTYAVYRIGVRNYKSVGS